VDPPPVGSRIRDVTAEGDVFAHVVAEATGRSVILDRRLTAGTRDLYFTPPAASERFAVSCERGDGAAAIQGFVAPAAGAYYVIVSNAADGDADYALVVARGHRRGNPPLRFPGRSTVGGRPGHDGHDAPGRRRRG
jgi:hypothetical protein